MARIEYFVLFYKPLCAERQQWTISVGVILLGLSYLILLYHVAYIVHMYIYHSGRWLALIANKS